MAMDISFARKEHIGIISLNRSDALNALNLGMIKAFQQQLSLWQNDDNIHAVVIKSDVEKAFCAGGDVRWLYEAGLQKSPAQLEFFWHEYRLNHYIHSFKKPYIALMNGITMGGGVGISLHGSHPIATERFVFAMPETGIGFFPDIGASYLLARCPGYAGIYLGLTGNRLNAEEAQSLNLVNYVISSTQIERIIDSLIYTDLSTKAHQSVDVCLQEFATPRHPPFSLQTKIDNCFAFDTVEEILAKLEKNDDEWSITLINNLAKKSPLSLKVTLAQIKKAKNSSLADCLKLDYCLVSKFMRDSDFYEGVRALLVDKDKNPHWQPATLELVSAAKVADYFASESNNFKLI